MTVPNYYGTKSYCSRQENLWEHVLNEQFIRPPATVWCFISSRWIKGHCALCRLEVLERENAVLKEKIYHLDDMLKSQQRKLRQMIEQVLIHTWINGILLYTLFFNKTQSLMFFLSYSCRTREWWFRSGTVSSRNWRRKLLSLKQRSAHTCALPTPQVFLWLISRVFITWLNHLFIQNRELRDQVDYFLNGQRSNSGLLSDSSPQIVYR